MARNPLQGWPNNDDRSVVNPLSAPDPNQITSADAWKHTINTIDGWLESEKQKAIDQGLWDPATGFPTKAGMLDAVHQYAWGMVGGTTSPGVRAMLPNLSGGIRAYHGSPHSFDKFDMSKIGTGEGAQAYGHGLYFAGNEGVARGYKEALAGKGPINPVLNGVEINPMNARLAMSNFSAKGDAEGAAIADVLGRTGGFNVRTPEEMRALFEGKNPRLTYPEGIGPEIWDAMQNRVTFPGRGHMYEVNLNVDPNRLLDWNKRLNAQTPEVTDALRNSMYSGYADTNLPGSQLAPLRAEGAKAMADIGIPGIKYLDAGSRGAGEGTSNYVMFHPDLIQILRKYGLIGTTGGAAAATMGANTEQ